MSESERTARAGRLKSFVLFTVSLLAVAGIAWVDVLTGPDYGLSLFYLVPIFVAGMRLSHAATVALSACAATGWFGADVMAADELLIGASVWNAVTRLLMYSFIGYAVGRLRRDRERLAALVDREGRLARVDALTGLFNTRAFTEKLRDESLRARRQERPLCLAYLDLDNFKRINDTHGHQAGDNLLTRVAEVLTESVRETDFVARLGGDEFAVLLVDTDPTQASAAGARIVAGVQELARGFEGSGLGVSVGIAAWTSNLPEPEQIIRAADRASYTAKRAGKSRVHLVVDEHCSGPAGHPTD